MNCSLVQTLAAVFTAIGTIAVAILAIWGDKIRTWIAGPQLELALRDTRGSLTVRNDGKRTTYYHINVRNRRNWSPARAVRILVTGVDKRGPDGTYFPEHVVAPLQLRWAYYEFHELLPTVVDADTCDFGFLDEDAGQFRLSMYVTPNNFRGSVAPGEAMRVHIIVSGHNVHPSKGLVLEVSWDGKWATDMDEMQRHLVIKEVTTG